MKREISNSMSIENDPYFEVITPVCKACSNYIANGKCKVYGERPKEYCYAKKYDCPKRDIDINNINYRAVKDKL
ncbi:MAG: hypothetical protein RSA08_00570 [Clostridia bacterium]